MSELKTFTKDGHSIDYIHIDNKSTQTIFMLHGYGANMRDLAPLAALAPELMKFNWVFPDGVIKVPIGPSMYGKAWFPIDMELLNQAMMRGQFETLFADAIPEGIEEAANGLSALVNELKTEEFILGGFSQGSMMANYLTFQESLNPQALILLSSTLVAKKHWQQLLNENSWAKPIFQSHGNMDPVLPVAQARQLTTLLRENKRDVYSIEFSGGHEIPPVVMKQLIEFFKKQAILKA